MRKLKYERRWRVRGLRSLPFVYIWSEYGDEIVVDKQPKNLRWDPTDKRLAQRLTLRERGLKQSKHTKVR